MSDMKPKGTKLKLGNAEYGLRFTLNAIDDIQDHFDVPIENLGELFNDSKKRIRNLRYILTVLINEDIDCVNDETGEKTAHVDERYVGRHIDANNMQEMMAAVFNSFRSGTPKSDDEAPNGQSE
jgi:hypothetical protein